jgi:hypothetical protein
MTLRRPAATAADPFLDAQVRVRDHQHGHALQHVQRARQQVVRGRAARREAGQRRRRHPGPLLLIALATA